MRALALTHSIDLVRFRQEWFESFLKLLDVVLLLSEQLGNSRASVKRHKLPDVYHRATSWHIPIIKSLRRREGGVSILVNYVVAAFLRLSGVEPVS